MSFAWPQNGAQNLGGTIRMDIRLTPPLDSQSGWGEVRVEVRSALTGLVYEGEATIYGQSRVYFDWPSGTQPDGTYLLRAKGLYFPLNGPPGGCNYEDNIQITTRNPSRSYSGKV